MENAPRSAESKKECGVGDTVVLTNDGIRKLLAKGFTLNDFSAESRFEIAEIKEQPSGVAYTVRVPQSGALVDLERGDFEVPFE